MKTAVYIEGKAFLDIPSVIQNDRPVWSFSIRREDDMLLNLGTGTVRIKLKDINSQTDKVNALCTIDNAATGLCHYDFGATDFNTVGVYDVQLVVTIGTLIESISLGRVSVLTVLP